MTRPHTTINPAPGATFAPSEGRWLHLAPQLYLPGQPSSPSWVSRIQLEAYSDALGDVGIALDTGADLVVTAPFADKAYLAGALRGGLTGWLIRLPRGLRELDATFVWNVPSRGSGISVGETLEHRMLIRLETGEGPLYSTDPGCWKGAASCGAERPVDVGFFAVSAPEHLSALRKDAGAKLSPLIDWGVPDEGDRVFGTRLSEAVDLPSLPWTNLGIAEARNGRRYDRQAKDTYQHGVA